MGPAAPGARALAPVRPARPARVQQHLSRWLMVYAMSAMAPRVRDYYAHAPHARVAVAQS